jgi:peptidoglycan hydrolase-like protein with peptidoglycan-binding domain
LEPTLRKGDRGEGVKYLQELLNDHGFALKTDGVFGSGTETAVKNFQQHNGLTQDGIVGPATWAKLEAEQSGGETVRPDCVQVERRVLTDIRQKCYDVIEYINRALDEG